MSKPRVPAVRGTTRRRFVPRVLGLVVGLVGTLALPLAAAPSPEPIRIALIEGLSGPFANAGEAVYRNLVWAVERVNQRGGVALPGGARPLELVRFDSKGSPEEAITLLRAALDRGIGYVLQGNSSAVAAAIVDALDKHNQRVPERRAIFLNYSAVDPALTNEACSFWHFRFDAHADMRLAALMSVLRDDRQVKKVYLIGQDYSFGRHVLERSREVLKAQRPDVEIVGEQLHPLGMVRDFTPYAAKIRASGAEAVITGNWGSDLTLLLRAAKDGGVQARFYTFYGNALGAPGTLRDAGVGTVLAVAEWHANVGGAGAEALYAAFRKRFPDPRDDYLHARMQVMIEMLVLAMERARSAEPVAVARTLEGLRYDGATLAGAHRAWMRAADHQLQQPLVVSVMEVAGGPQVPHDVEGSGYGFRTVRTLSAEQAEMPHRCAMVRPD